MTGENAFDRLKRLFSVFSEKNAGEEAEGLTMAKVRLEDEEERKRIQEEFEDGIIRYIQNQFDERKKQKNGLELQWRLNINYYNGDQFTYIDSVLNDVVETPEYTPWEERNVFNEIAPNIETRFAFLSKRKNLMKNRPASSSAEDRTSAKIGNRILASTRSRLKMSDKQQDANLIAGIMGTAIWKTTWDTTKGRMVGVETRVFDSEEEDLLPTEEYERQLLGDSLNRTKKYIREGDVNTTVHSPFEFYPENVNKPIRENQRVMHVVLMSPEEVYEKWGVIEEGESHETYKIVSSDNRLYGGSVSGRMVGRTLGVTKIENSVRVYEEHELPSPRYPEGRLIICTDHNLLYYGPQPEQLGENGEFELCFDVQQSLRTDGFFGKSLVERLIPLQNKFNALKNRKQDYINRVSLGVLVAEEGALTDEEYLRQNGIGPGEILTYNQGFRQPAFLEPGTLPSVFENEEADILNSFNRLSGVSQLAQQSVTPSNVTSGVALSSLAEQDDTRIGLEAENIRACIASIGKKWLLLYKNHVKYARMVRDIGRNDEFEISEFVGNDLTSFDVFIEAETESSDTLAQRRQKVIELLNSGLFNDTETGNITNEGRIKVFEMLELGNWEDFVDADDAQQRRADRENNAMLIGKKPQIREFDDDVIHISKHNNFRLRAEYEEALQEHPEIDELFRAHVEDHLHNLQVKSSTGITDGASQGGMNLSAEGGAPEEAQQVEIEPVQS